MFHPLPYTVDLYESYISLPQLHQIILLPLFMFLLTILFFVEVLILPCRISLE
jgi:hypothetical protein